MKFCERCGGLMLPKKIGERQVLVCSACGEVSEGSEYKLVKSYEGVSEIPVIEEVPPTLPTVSIRCPSCANEKAFWWLRQTRRADEPPTRFYRCTRCSHTWREYT